MHYHFFIINKYGLLIYERAYRGANQLSSNDMIRFSSTLHSIHAISAQLTPVGVQKKGMHTLNSPTFKLVIYSTKTGAKFCLISDPQTSDMEGICRQAYQLYCNYALKNPFYEQDQQIKIEAFDEELDSLLNR